MTPINLNKARKARARSHEKAKADENAVKFGLTKAQCECHASQVEQSNTRLSRLRFEDK